MTTALPKIAVTGATGFIGGHLVRALEARGAHITALVRPGFSGSIGNADLVEGRLRNRDALGDLCAGADAVVHLAGLTKARTLNDFRAVNAIGAGEMANVAAESGCRLFVQGSTLAAREPQLSDYAATKRGGEDAVLANAGAMRVCIVRIPAVFGPDDPATKPFFDTMRAGWLPAPGGETGRSGKISLIFVTDLANFLAETALSADPPELVSPAGILDTRWADMADAAGDALGKPVRLLPIPPFFLHIAGAAAEVFSKLTGRPGHLNRGKVREMLHMDWSADAQVSRALTLSRAMALAFGVDADARKGQTPAGSGVG
ncbi:MAG: NAD-dependent epimerase/dehydratase family protein [Pseudomonadota bacterium]